MNAVFILLTVGGAAIAWGRTAAFATLLCMFAISDCTAQEAIARLRERVEALESAK